MTELEDLSIKECFANPGNYGGTRTASQIKYLVIHYTGNDGDHDEANANYYRDNVVEASAHYFVDDDSITRSVPDLRVAWAVGGKKWSDCAQTGGGTMYGVITNTNSISVELCDTKRDGTLMVTEATLARALPLCRALMRRYNITIDRVYRHFDVTGKYCPAYYMDPVKWAQFKSRLAEEDQDMNAERLNTMEEIRAKAPYALPTVQKLIAMGALRGGGKKDADGNPADMDLSLDMLRVLVMVDRAGGIY